MGHTRYYTGGGSFVIPDWSSERKRMVDEQLRGRGITDERVLAAMGAIPREEFLPLEMRVLSYRDDPACIGFGQTISQPYMTALMAQQLELGGNEEVLDVGTGSGYAAALLGALAARVISIELIASLAARAAETLRRTGWKHNVTIIAGDGSVGYPEGGPYDAISVAAAAFEVPKPLIQQLKDPGRVVIPVGTRRDQSLLVVKKQDGQVESRAAGPCRFVLLRGDEGWR
jgi:protein-L-isoaspartate(D-aspartate) O-methyltransferase